MCLFFADVSYVWTYVVHNWKARTCNEYCAQQQAGELVCYGAWKDSGDTCSVSLTGNCDTDFCNDHLHKRIAFAIIEINEINPNQGYLPTRAFVSVDLHLLPLQAQMEVAVLHPLGAT